MKSVLVLVLLGLACATAYSPSKTGAKWEDQDAVDKTKTLWTAVLDNINPYGWYGAARLAELFVENLDTSFDYVGDDMPSQSLGLEERPKLIHSVGAIAKCKFVSTGDHPYTGLFKGAESGFLRVSHAVKPVTSPPLIIPAISLKFLRTDQPSGNLFAMFSLLGQESFNFFEHDFSNHPPTADLEKIPLAQKVIFKAFAKASKWPTVLGLSDLAEFDEDGNQESSPRFPFRLVFHPTTYLHTVFPTEPQQGDSYYISQFEQLSNPTNLVYEVYAQDNPLSDDLALIGSIVTTSDFSGTQYGDEHMFFRHTRFEADSVYVPDWVAPLETILAYQTANTPYTYPDMPFN